MHRPNQLAVYIHWPFCAAKCPYCDFNSHVRRAIDQQVYLEAYRRAIAHYAQKLAGRQVGSVFFGGGTPSLMEPQTVEGILEAIRKGWSVANDFEVTLEANPTSVEAQKFEAFRQAGVNRVSLGVQALRDEDLRFLGREHDVAEALRAIEIAGKTFDRYSFDLIYARPKQSKQAWEAELCEALRYARGHLSLYQLTIERNTPFYMRHTRGEFALPGEAQGAAFYHITQDILEDAGLPAYEVSNHGAAGQECAHNLVYWHYGDYIGIGAGAHGRFVKGGVKYATRDHAAPEIWLERVATQGHGAHPAEVVSAEDRFAEGLMMGLRLRGGVDLSVLEVQSGVRAEEMLDHGHVAALIAEGWLERKGSHLRLNREGWLRLNAIIPYVLKE